LLWAASNWGNPYHSAGEVLGNSYAINTRLIFPGGWKEGRSQSGDLGFGYLPAAEKSVHLADLPHAASTALIADAYMAWPARPGPTTGFFHNGDPLPGGNGPYLQQASCVYGFVDGHAKYMNPQGCFYTNGGQLYGGRISFYDDNYKNADWVPGSFPPIKTNGTSADWSSSCQ
jgi:hypothetical protein